MSPLSNLSAAALAFALTFGAAAPAAFAADTGTLTVTFQGIKTQTGAVLLSLASSEAAYDGKAPTSAEAAPVTGDSVSVTFKDLAPGRYAIKAFHDINGDGKMSTNPFGIPTEPFAFSNNAHGSMGPAKWADAGFEVKAGANTQTITID